MKRFAALMLALALGICCTTVTTQQAEILAQVKDTQTRTDSAVDTDSKAELPEADAKISPVLDDVITDLVDISLANETRLKNDEPLDCETGNAFLDAALDVHEVIRIGKNSPAFCLVPTEDEYISELCVCHKDVFGNHHHDGVRIYYDHRNGECFGKHPQEGIYRCGFDYNANTKLIVAQEESYQRIFGFSTLYDYLGAVTLGYDYLTQRIIFTCGDTEYCVLLWKGNYHWKILVGAEVGLYKRKAGPHLTDHFRCADKEDMIGMYMKLYDDDETYIELDNPAAWWLTAFKLDEEGLDKRKVKLDVVLTFNSAEMCDAFTQAAVKAGINKISSDGRVVRLTW